MTTLYRGTWRPSHRRAAANRAGWIARWIGHAGTRPTDPEAPAPDRPSLVLLGGMARAGYPVTYDRECVAEHLEAMGHPEAAAAARSLDDEAWGAAVAAALAERPEEEVAMIEVPFNPSPGDPGNHPSWFALREVDAAGAPTGERHVYVRCGNGHNCRVAGGAGGHEVGDDGRVGPSLLCPVPGCGWHQVVRLAGWPGGA